MSASIGVVMVTAMTLIQSSVTPVAKDDLNEEIIEYILRIGWPQAEAPPLEEMPLFRWQLPVTPASIRQEQEILRQEIELGPPFDMRDFIPEMTVEDEERVSSGSYPMKRIR